MQGSVSWPAWSEVKQAFLNPQELGRLGAQCLAPALQVQNHGARSSHAWWTLHRQLNARVPVGVAPSGAIRSFALGQNAAALNDAGGQLVVCV